ncbi:uncharacterized protein J3R85_009960 [Psidium guajava]|nr:uncharacterized protein J3R85_009960 [Psidium guajava]
MLGASTSYQRPCLLDSSFAAAISKMLKLDGGKKQRDAISSQAIKGPRDPSAFHNKTLVAIGGTCQDLPPPPSNSYYSGPCPKLQLPPCHASHLQ